MADSRFLLDVQRLSKNFGEIVAVNDISIKLLGGQVVGLIGSNGAGKSTLLRCLSGNEMAEEGTILLNGEPYRPKDVASARTAGIRLVEQELHIFPELSVAENWYLLTKQSLKSEKMEADSWARNPNSAAATLEVRDVQKLLLDAATYVKPKILLLDEPTALLDDQTADQFLIDLRRNLADESAIIVSTHRINDLSKFDRWIFIRDGSVSFDTIEYIKAYNYYLNEGNDVITIRKDNPLSYTLPRLIVSTDVYIRHFGGITFNVYSNQLLGVISPSAAPLFEAARHLALSLKRTKFISFLGPERRRDHIFPQLSIQDHIRLTLADDLDRKRLLEILGKFDFPINYLRSNLKMSALSGGTQQKLLLSLALSTRSAIRILCEPMRGIDQSNRLKFREILNEVSADEVGNIIFSYDADFLLEVADKILIVKSCNDGQLFDRNSFKSSSEMRLLL